MNEIVDRIKTHYETSDSILLASNLGLALAKSGLWPIPGNPIKLLDYLETMKDEVKIERDGAYVAISDTPNHHKIIAAIKKRKATRFLKSLPRPIINAFIINIGPSERIFLQTQRPFRFSLDKPDTGDDELKEIDLALRAPGLNLYDLNDVSAETLVNLHDNIKTWLKDSGLDEEEIILAKSPPVSKDYMESDKSKSALERLIYAQPPELRSRLVIPADIALVLINRK